MHSLHHLRAGEATSKANSVAGVYVIGSACRGRLRPQTLVVRQIRRCGHNTKPIVSAAGGSAHKIYETGRNEEAIKYVARCKQVNSTMGARTATAVGLRAARQARQAYRSHKCKCAGANAVGSRTTCDGASAGCPQQSSRQNVLAIVDINTDKLLAFFSAGPMKTRCDITR